MGSMVRLTAKDGHQLDAWLVRPEGKPGGGLVIAQEMYGVTDYLKSVCDFYAGHGYACIAPAVYDRKERNLVLAYDEGPQHNYAQELFNGWDWPAALIDLDAGRTAIADVMSQEGKIGIVGFCFGGSLAWLAACRYPFDAAVCNYGSDMPKYIDETARCPVLAQVGSADKSFPPDRVAAFRKAHPDVTFHIHPGAPHGFDNPMRPARYHAEACKNGRALTLEFLAKYVG
jgi:carboxymethylenebutenolidase